MKGSNYRNTLFTSFALFCFFCSSTAVSQVIKKQEFKFKGTVYGIAVTRSTGERFEYECKVFKDTVDLFTFSLVDMKVEIFNNKFVNGFKTYFSGQGVAVSGVDEETLFDIASSVHLNITISQLTLVNAPVAGYISIAEKTTLTHDISVLKSEVSRDSLKSLIKQGWKLLEDHGSKYNLVYTYEFTIDSLQLEIADGAIKYVLVMGTRKDTADRSISVPMIFYNWWPIPFSALFDYGFSRHQTRVYYQKDLEYYLDLQSIITYLPRLQSNSEDFSPANGVYTFEPGADMEKSILYKEESSKILQARVYTDFAGISNDNPNGLIQTELSKKFIINHSRLPAYETAYFGFFNYVEPKFVISKIEENNRNLLLINNPYSTADSSKYVTTLSLLNYQNTSLGFSLRFVDWNLPYFKFNVNLDIGASINRVALRDSLKSTNGNQTTIQVNDFNVSTYSLFAELYLRFNPDTRYGIQIGAKSIWLNQLTDRATQIGRIPDLDTEKLKNKDFILGFEVNGFMKQGENNELFFRLRSFHQFFDLKVNIFQFQLGYSFYLLNKKK